MNYEELQDKVNIDYPPTDTFIVESLVPTGVLRQRASLISEHFPNFFKGENLLDIGCSKGWFSNFFSQFFKKTVAIDKNKEMLMIAKQLNKNNVEFQEIGFKNFYYQEQFDKIFLGNVAHHVTKEVGGFEWIAKLAALSCGEVLIEGPKDSKCKDMESVFENPKIYDSFLSEMDKYFTLEKIVPTTSYTPDRYFMLFKLKPLKKATNEFRKKYKKDAFVGNNPVDLMVCSSSPYSNNVTSIYEDGWGEERLTESPWFYKENQMECFKLHCKHNIYLNKIGYIDFDSATINFGRKTNIYFDKSSTVPILKLTDYTPEGYIKMFKNSYDTVPLAYAVRISNAIKTKDTKIIQKTFEGILNEINPKSIKEETLIDAWDDKNRKWPSIVYIETTNFCNAHCLSCLNDECKRIRGIMDLETFKKIADKVKAKGLEIGAMFCFGEPLMDPTIFKKYAYAKEIDVFTPSHVGLNTNVSFLTSEKYDEILEHTPNIILSFFNVGKEYERLTGGLSWKTSFENATNFIKYRDEHKPSYPILIGVNTVKGYNLESVKKAFKGYKVKFVQDAELRWAGATITGVIDRMIMYNSWRCDGFKGALQIKNNGDCEFCAYDIVGSPEGGETKFGNILTDSWEELDRKFRAAWRKGNSCCLRCDYWHKCKTVIKNNFKKPDPLPEDWYKWQDKLLKPGEPYID